MGLAVSLSGFACYHQVAPTGLDENGRAPEECEMRAEPGAPLSFFQDCHHWVNGARTFCPMPLGFDTLPSLQSDLARVDDAGGISAISRWLSEARAIPPVTRFRVPCTRAGVPAFPSHWRPLPGCNPHHTLIRWCLRSTTG